MGRGPSYPYVGLEEAIGLTHKMFDYAKRGPAAVDSVVTDAWGYTTTSSSGGKVLAALKAYGLIEDAPAASGKAAIKLTPRSIRILLDDQDTELKRDEIRKAALSPKWYEYCWKTWGKEMPPAMKSQLLIEHGFVPSTVESFLKDYKKTIAFAGLLDGRLFGGVDESQKESDTGPVVGDWVQAEINGIETLPKPHKLNRILKDPEHGDYGFVEGQLGGIPYKNLIRVEAPEIDSKSPIVPPAAFAPPPRGEGKMLTDSISQAEGVSVQIQWPSQMTTDAYEDFLHQLEGLKKRIYRAVIRDSSPEVKSENEKTS